MLILNIWNYLNFNQKNNGKNTWWLTYFLTPLMLRVLFLYISGGTYSLILFTLSVYAWGNRRRNPFCILYWCLAWGSKPGFTSNMPTHYLLDYGDFTWWLEVSSHFMSRQFMMKICLPLPSSYLLRTIFLGIDN